MNKIDRSNEVDIIRMAALVGICVVNVPFMALPVEVVFAAPDSLHGRASVFFVECFLQMKFFLLFSFIFGWGMAVQSQSAKASGQSFVRRYFRRMLVLAVLGVLHAVFVFSGDILLLYALLGSLLWLIKDCPAVQLLKIAAWMVPLSMLFLSILAVILDASLSDGSEVMTTTKASGLGGGFLDATRARLAEWPITFVFLFFLQGPLAFGAFATGLAAAKTGFFTEGSIGFTLLKRRVPLLLVIALPLNALYAAVVGGIVPESNEMLSFLGFALLAIGAPALSFIYLYLFVRLSRKITVPKILILSGRNSLSSYVCQGVLAGVCFGAYGLGLFGTLGPTALLPLSILIALLAMLAVGTFAQIFGSGPLEPLLRIFR